ncbi:hypothetical protein HS141_11255 [Cetobacterium somerae]|uniref:hypothetical protein n=1 Tax=Cetobacterium somerae TaxID=188913 RepID=UPI00211DAD89|nr:hypothetical protein [Cetobacterium somerae]MCQ9627508.1 hypothetical protein [Cetobacterium somerae]
MKRKFNNRIKKKSKIERSGDTVLATVPIEIRLDDIDPNALVTSLINRRRAEYKESSFLIFMEFLKIKFKNEGRKIIVDLDENFDNYGNKIADVE